jgi:ligand-binding sensor domain-containing protein/anti-sigma regulatory factor (Ser/Thr protein kinase)
VKFRFSALALFLLTAAGALALDPARMLTQYSHRTWGIEQGLAQPTIYSISQTHNGYLWLGTQDSLIRFDGIRFRAMDEVLGSPFDHRLVHAVLEDGRGNLWIGTVGSGLIRLAADGSVTPFGKARGMPSENITCLASDSRGALWVCTEEGLVRRDDEHVRVFTTADGMPGNHPDSFCAAADGSDWVAFSGYGLYRLEADRAKLFAPALPSSLKTVRALSCARDGSVWAGTENGLVRIRDGATTLFTTTNGLADNWISAITEGPDGNIWIGTHGGLSRYRADGSFESYRSGNGLSHSTVLSLSFDREGSLWVGTKNGLDQFTDANVIPYTTAQGMPSDDAGPVIEDAAGRLWVGTLGAGLGEFDGKRFRAFTTREGLSNDVVLSLENGRDGDLWVGTKHGVTRIRGDRVVARYGRKDGLSGDEARAIFFDPEGTLWVGTESGLDAFDGTRFLERSIPGLPHIDNILALAGGSRTRLFVSAEPNSMYALKDGVLAYHSLEGISRPVTSFYALDRLDHGKHIVYMGTLGSGLLRWHNGNVSHVYIRDGLYDNRIYSILPDGKDNLWMASSKGIFRVSTRELEDFAAGRIHRIQSLPFTTGQLRFECQPGVQPAGWRAHDGRLWFSTTTGLVVIDPENLMTSRVAPPVEITSVLVNGERTAVNGADLKPGERNLEIRYSGLSFVSPEKVTFRYILQGYDKGWTDAGTRREAFYTNLPPGHFRFRVTARNADGVGSENDASIVFTIAPRLYQRVWFWPLIVTLLAGIATAAYRMRVRRLRAEFDLVFGERNRIARELHDTLLQGLSGVTMQLQALRGMLPRSTARETLGEIIEDAGRCSADARRSLFGLRMADGLSDGGFSGEVARLVRQTTANCSSNLILEIERVSLDDHPDLAFQLLRIVQEAVLNAVRHACAATIRVVLRVSDGRLELLIEDDGAGFNPAAVCENHYGVAGIRERANEIGAKLRIASTAGLGTQLSINVRVSKNLTHRFRGRRPTQTDRRTVT